MGILFSEALAPVVPLFLGGGRGVYFRLEESMEAQKQMLIVNKMCSRLLNCGCSRPLEFFSACLPILLMCYICTVLVQISLGTFFK